MRGSQRLWPAAPIPAGGRRRPDEGVPRARLDSLRLRAAAGAAPPRVDGLPPRAARALAVAVAAGAPLVPALDAAEEGVRRHADRRRAVGVATAQSRTVIAGLLGAPILLLPALAGILDLDVAGFYATPAGLVVAGVTAGLLTAGLIWVRWLLARVGRALRPQPTGAAVGWWAHRRRPPRSPSGGMDEVVDLTATAMSGGLGAAAALRIVADHREDLGPGLRRLAVAIDLNRTRDDLPADIERLGRLLVDAAHLGAPSVPALRDLARRLREDAHARALAEAGRLPVRLTFPAALCLLPASLLVVGAPLVASGLAAAGV